jgi:hypothetical protein
MENKIKDYISTINKTNNTNVINKIYDTIFINKTHDTNVINKTDTVPKKRPLLTEFEEYFIFWNYYISFFFLLFYIYT